MSTLQIAIQANILPGNHPLEKFQRARDLALNGIEWSVDALSPDGLKEVAAASAQTGVRVSAVNIGHTRLIHPDYAVREQALVAMRQAMTLAVDLGAQGVVFKPFYAPGAVLPDLHPYKSSLELEAELLVTQLRATLCDLAYALGTELLMLPINYQETHLIRRIDHAAVIREKLDHHPHLKIAASLYQMVMEGESLDALHYFAGDIGYLYVPMSFAEPASAVYTAFGKTLGEALRHAAYSGWLTLEASSETGEEITSAQIRPLVELLLAGASL
jgi:sugar phosphate isomerase/epimerase